VLAAGRARRENTAAPMTVDDFGFLGFFNPQ